MKRAFKVTALLIVLIVVTATAVSAQNKGSLRLGLEFGDPIAVLIIRPAPFDIKIGYSFDANNPWLFLSGDYRIISGYQLIDFLHLFLGVGAYVQLPFDQMENFELGLRIPVGLQVFLIDNVVELFLEVAPTVGFLPSIQAFPRWQGYIGFTILVPKFWK
ncbi:MAG: DUF3996 domain-containing protein [Spirochaetaceae bacterium]|nr:MAG: DUF3996 domain-containing protein [Spirochaetaceae bacterium]